jgi:hypothetical protein
MKIAPATHVRVCVELVSTRIQERTAALGGDN